MHVQVRKRCKLLAVFACCRGRGQVVAAACAAETVVLATSKGYLLRYQWDEYGNEKGGAGVPYAPAAEADANKCGSAGLIYGFGRRSCATGACYCSSA
jgi:hypothetical protein